MQKKNRILSIFLCLALIMSIIPMGYISASAETTLSFNGSGSITDPYLIEDEDDLKALATYVNDGNDCTNLYFKQTADITVEDFEPIGKYDNGYYYFNGTYDGDNNEINGTIGAGDKDYQALFGAVGVNGTIKNVINNATVKGNNYVSGVVGYTDGGKIENCQNNGTITGKYFNVAGIVGYSKGGTITNCNNAGHINSVNSSAVAGIVGNNQGGTITNCNNRGTVNGRYYVGGIVGDNGNYTISSKNVTYIGTITNCYNTGDVKGTGICVGGVVGMTGGGTIENCYNTGYVKGKRSIGGVLGSSINGTFENCFNTGGVEGEGEGIGGVIGYTDGGTIENCYNTGVVTGEKKVGGVAGENNGGTIENCYNEGKVKGTSENVGGVAGENRNAIIKNSYNTGKIIGEKNVGGVAGLHKNYSEDNITIKAMIINCYNSGVVEGTENIGGFVGEKFDNLYIGGVNVKGKIENGYYLSSTADKGVGGSDGTATIEIAPFDTNGTFEDTTYVYNSNYNLLEALNAWVTDENTTADGYKYTKWIKSSKYPVFQKFGKGDGTKANPYEIKTEVDLINLAGIVNAGSDCDGQYFKQTADINVTDFEPIGYFDGDYRYFNGTYDGDGNEINGTIGDETKDYQALFGVVGENGVIKNVINNAVVKGNDYVGGIVGENKGEIEKVINNADIIGAGDYVGGIVGENKGEIEKVINNADIIGTGDYVGGIVGYATSNVHNCYNTSNIIGKDYVGGIAGGISGCGIDNCYSVAAAIGDGTNVGGIVGGNDNGTIAQCYYNKEVYTTSNIIAGVEGKTTAYMKTSGFVDNLNYSANSKYANEYAIEKNEYPHLKDVPLSGATKKTGTDILVFKIADQLGKTAFYEDKHEIEVVMLTGTDVTKLVPSIVLSTGATSNKTAGAPIDFTNPVTYTVTAEDKSTQEWTVTVKLQDFSDLESVSKAKDLIEAGTYTFAQATANTISGAKTEIAKQINALDGMKATSITISESDIVISDFTSASAETAADDGKDGEVEFKVDIAIGLQKDTTDNINATIEYTEFTGLKDAQAVLNAKELIENMVNTFDQTQVKNAEDLTTLLLNKIKGLDGMTETDISFTEDDINVTSFTPVKMESFANLIFSNGKFDVGVKVAKGNESAIADITGDIEYSLFAGLTDFEIVQIARNLLNNGRASILERENQDDNSQDLQIITDGLFGKLGTKSTLTHKSGNEYTLKLTKGDFSAIKDITINVNGTSETNNEIAKKHINSLNDISFKNSTDTDMFTNETSIKNYLNNTVKPMFNDNSIKMAIDIIEYTPPVNGSEENKTGVAGICKYTVTFSKGIESATTDVKTIIIQPVAFVAEKPVVDDTENPKTDANSNFAFISILALISVAGVYGVKKKLNK